MVRCVRMTKAIINDVSLLLWQEISLLPSGHRLLQHPMIQIILNAHILCIVPYSCKLLLAECQCRPLAANQIALSKRLKIPLNLQPILAFQHSFKELIQPNWLH